MFIPTGSLRQQDLYRFRMPANLVKHFLRSSHKTVETTSEWRSDAMKSRSNGGQNEKYQETQKDRHNRG